MTKQQQIRKYAEYLVGKVGPGALVDLHDHADEVIEAAQMSGTWSSYRLHYSLDDDKFYYGILSQSRDILYMMDWTPELENAGLNTLEALAREKAREVFVERFFRNGENQVLYEAGVMESPNDSIGDILSRLNEYVYTRDQLLKETPHADAQALAFATVCDAAKTLLAQRL